MAISKIITSISGCLIVSCAGLNAFAFTVNDIDVTINSSVSEAYDDNVTYLKEDPKPDLITSLKLGMSAKYEGKTRQLQVSANVNHQFFAKNSSFDNTSEDVTAQLLNEFTDTDRAILKETFIHAEEPRSFEDQFARATGRYSYLLNKFSAAYHKEIFKELTLITSYANELYRPSREDLANSDLHKASAQLDYTLSADTIALLSYSFDYRTFDPGKSAKTHALIPGLRQYFTPQLYLDAKTGAHFIQSFNGERSTKPYFFASLTDEVNETTTSAISFTKAYSTNPYTEDIFNYWQIALNLVKQLTQRLRSSISAFYGKGKYVSFDIKDTFQGTGAGLSYDLNDSARVKLDYSYSQANSNFTSREYVKNTVSLALTLEF